MNYLLESIVCITTFYGLYYLIFRRLTFIRLNRFYLLSSLVVGLLLPLVSYQIQEVVKIPVKVEYEETNLVPFVKNSSTPLISNIPTEETFDWNVILPGIFVLGILFMMIKFSIIIYKLLKISRMSSGNDFISTKSKYANSSFFNLIFIDDSNLSDNEIKQILEHEKWHIRLFHSYDLLFVEILKIVFWFNPILWLYQRSLSEIHEFEVDTRMIQVYNPQAYAHLLLKLASPRTQSATHQFSRKPLTDRIHFLFTKQKSVPMKRLAYLSVLPILGAFFMAFSVEKVVDYQVVEESSKYFKIVRENFDSYEFGNVNVTAYNKISPTLYLYKGKIAFTSGSNEISEAMIMDASKYFKNYGYTLSILSKQFDTTKKNLERIEISLIDEKNENKKRVKDGNENYPENNEKFNFDLKKMRAKSARSIGGAITIMANRDSGLHFVAPLSPPPPPPVPSAPARPPLTPKAPKASPTLPVPPKPPLAPKAPPKPPVPPKLGLNILNSKTLGWDKNKIENLAKSIKIILGKHNEIAVKAQKIKNGIYINKPIIQKEWQMFLNCINEDKSYSSEYRKKMIPDNWRKIRIKSDELPLTFVSFKQANEYCNWKSKLLNDKVKNKESKIDYITMITSEVKDKKTMSFRLPTENEWEMAVKRKLLKKEDDQIGFYTILEM